MTSSRRIAARIRAMPPAEPEPGWEERARQRYQESIMSIEITDCANRGKVYHNVKLLDGRRADVAVGSAIDGLGIEVYVGGTSIAAGVDEASSVLGDSCPLIISSMEATADVIGRRDPRLSDIRDEIDRRRRHCDAAAWLTRQLGSSAYVTVAGEPTSWPPPPPSRRQSMRDVDIVARCKNCDTPTPTEADMLAHRCPDAAT